MTVEELIEELQRQPAAATVRVAGTFIPSWADSEVAYEPFNYGPDRLTYHHGEVIIVCD